MARIRASKLAKAGLRGRYAQADCAAGRRAFQLAQSGRGSYLWGQPGRGKTYAAACAVRLALAAGWSAKLVSAADLLAEVRDGFGDGGDRLALGRARTKRLLALDDLGAERQTEWAMETLERLVDARTSDGLPTIVTSNYAIGEVRRLWGGVSGARIASRLAGSCESVEMGGPDWRLR